MKRSPDIAAIEQVLRSSNMVSGGFLGHDSRPLEEIIEADASEIAKLNVSVFELADRMRHITGIAERGLGTNVQVDDKLKAKATDVRGHVPCPWPHPARFCKTVVEVCRTDTGETIQWSVLNIHMIEEHGFFEGYGSPFRVDPEKLIRIIF